MPSLGPAEILVILVVALLVFGPNKMPDVARQAGKAFREFRRVQHHLRNEISGAMSDLGLGSDPGPESTTGPQASGSMGGGDPVPMLEPKIPDADPASGSADPAPTAGSDGPTPPSPSAPPSPSPPPSPSAPPSPSPADPT